MNYISELKNTKNQLFKKINILFLAFIFFLFFLDRISKIKVINNSSDNTYFINDFINIDLIWNIGIGFGLLSTDSSLFYNLVTFIIGLVILTLFYVLIFSKNLDKVIYSIITGGALGNFYDRVIYKAVPDFIDLHYNDLHWFIFNVADIFITIGIVALLVKGVFEKK